MNVFNRLIKNKNLLKIQTNSLLRINKKNFIIGEQVQKGRELEKLILQNTRKEDQIEFYEPKTPLVFENNLHRLIEIPDKLVLNLKYRTRLLSAGRVVSFTYCLWSLVTFRWIHAAVSGIICFTLSGYNQLITLSRAKTVYRADLLDNGKVVRFEFFYPQKVDVDGKPKIINTFIEEDINRIRLLADDETEFMEKMNPKLLEQFTPIIVDKNIFLVLKESIVKDPEIWDAILLGKYIVLKKE